MSSAVTTQDIARNARWLTQALDAKVGVVRIVEMHRESYRETSFLDDRLLKERSNRLVVPWSVVGEAASAVTRCDARWIFHISHVGSTLMSRLLGEIPGVLSVREPRFLRDLMPLAAPERVQFIAAAQRLFSRTFAPDEIAVIKTTSTVGQLAAELMPTDARALFMYVTPSTFLPTILAGNHSAREMHIRAHDRVRRLSARGITLPEPRNYADLVAVAWACEMVSLEAAMDARPDCKIRWIDFDAMLENIEGELAASAQSLHLAVDEHRVSAIANGPVLGRYSKALEREYSPERRRRLISDAERRYQTEINAAIDRLHAAAGQSPLLARALERAGG